MEITGEPSPPASRLFMGDIGWRIFIEGEIEGCSAGQLESFLIENAVPSASVISIHSGGGSLEGGLSLGRVLRAYELCAHVAKRGKRHEGGFWMSDPGICMSAAALAFLGGEFRFVGDRNKYGVHRFTFGPHAEDIEGRAQMQSSAVVEYIRSMDVDTALFALASEIPSSEILILPETTLLRLNVVNNGRKDPKWTIESVDEGLYLKGEQKTVFGVSKFLIVVPFEGDPMLDIFFEAGVSAKDAMQMGVNRLVTGDSYIPMQDKLIQRVDNDGQIRATYSLNDELLARIGAARTVGMIFQWTEESPVFLGFDSMPFEEGAAKLPGLLGVYRRSPI